MITIQEFDNDNKLLKTTKIESNNFDKALNICKKSKLQIFEMHHVSDEEANSARGVKKPNGHIDWKRIEN